MNLSAARPLLYQWYLHGAFIDIQWNSSTNNHALERTCTVANSPTRGCWATIWSIHTWIWTCRTGVIIVLLRRMIRAQRSNVDQWGNFSCGWKKVSVVTILPMPVNRMVVKSGANNHELTSVGSDHDESKLPNDAFEASLLNDYELTFITDASRVISVAWPRKCLTRRIDYFLKVSSCMHFFAFLLHCLGRS